MEEKKFNIKKFGIDVYNYRNNELQVSRREFSEKTGLSDYIINHIENSHTKPQINDAYKLAIIMGKTLQDYFD